MHNKIIILVTGKSGAGKTFFSEYLSIFLDAKHISLDEISHNSLKNAEIMQKIQDIFGNDIFVNNKIDRKKLGKIAFTSPEKMKKLNSICQEYIENQVDEIISKTDKKYVVLDYFLICKMKYYEMSKCKILVSSDVETRFSRLLSRDNVSKEYLELRENNMPEFDEKTFDFIIRNDGNNDIKPVAKFIADSIKINL